MDADKPAKLPGFLAILEKTTDDTPLVQAIVKTVIGKRSFAETLQYYEIRDEKMLRALVEHVVEAVDHKMQVDFEAHKVGSTSFRSVVYQAIAFSLIAGAQLAKDKKI